MVGERGITLLEGQKQRSAIAGAVVRVPDSDIGRSLSAVDTQQKKNPTRLRRDARPDDDSDRAPDVDGPAKRIRLWCLKAGGILIERGTHDEP